MTIEQSHQQLRIEPMPKQAIPENHRALSIAQPFVEQILRGEKKIEYRGFATKVRGLVYLYATKKPRMDIMEACEFKADKLPLGLIVGTVEIVDCTGVPGDYEWHLANPVRFKKPLKSERQPQPSFWFAFVE